jgi:hypothetical protein
VSAATGRGFARVHHIAHSASIVIYLLYGAASDGILVRVQEWAIDVPQLAPIELWRHAAVGAAATPIGNIS